MTDIFTSLARRINSNIRFGILSTFLSLGLASQAAAAPILRSDVTVNSAIVTVGDMFKNSGMYAEKALFRSPAPGTTGQVSVQNITIAAAKIGIEQFENPGLFAVNVARDGVSIDENALETLIAAELTKRGVLSQGMNVTIFLNRVFNPIFAQNSSTPVLLTNLRYVRGDNRFSARFELAGQSRMIDIAGRLDFSISTPHLIRTMPAGTILKDSDIDLREVPIQLANGAGLPMLEQLIGKQLQRNLLGGATLRLNDVMEPNLIARNQVVTLFLKSGAMTLTVKGRALADAAQGEPVSVLNMVSNTVVQGIAISEGTVQISTNSTLVASL